jgi:hypothetical protein
MDHTRSTQDALAISGRRIAVLARRRNVGPVLFPGDVVDRQVPTCENAPQMAHISHPEIRGRVPIDTIGVSIVTRTARYVSNVNVDGKIGQPGNPVVEQRLPPSVV